MGTGGQQLWFYFVICHLWTISLGQEVSLNVTEEENAKIDPSTGIPMGLLREANGTGFWLEGVVENFKQPNVIVSIPEMGESIKERPIRENIYFSPPAPPEDSWLTFMQLVHKNNYPVKQYRVNTSDEYILTLYRIRHGRNNFANKYVKRPVVFLMHGLLDSADDWVIMGPNKGLAYMLADAGYDVFLGNARGNKYSKHHMRMTSDEAEFWEFSWDEIGYYDLPAMIDFTLTKTKQKQLYYIGHSQGTTSFFVMCSMRPEYNAKIRKMFALAPVAWMSNTRSALVRLVSSILSGKISFGRNWLLKTMGNGEFLPHTNLITIAGGYLCSQNSIIRNICYNSLFSIIGYDLHQMDVKMLPIIMGHVPAGASVNQIKHYGQSYMSGDFRRFDYGTNRNLGYYKSVVPPRYNLSQVTCPISLYCSTNDYLSNLKDVTTLKSNLKNSVVDKFIVANNFFNHMDYMWAKNIYSLLYRDLLNKIKIDIAKK